MLHRRVMWRFLRGYGWLVAVMALMVALWFFLVDPTPPREIELAAGSTNGAYHAFGLRLAGEWDAAGGAGDPGGEWPA